MGFFQLLVFFIKICIIQSKDDKNHKLMAYRDTFKRPHTFLPVIHAESIDQAINNSRIAIEKGADGIFLIGHRMRTGALLATYNAVVQHLPQGTWIGINFLREPFRPQLVEVIPMTCPGVWTDQNGIHESPEGGMMNSYEALDLYKKLRERDPNPLWFGGVGFKGQPPTENLTAMAKIATRYMDVITTSGDHTGSAPSVEKVRLIRRAIGDHPIAIASGMTPENVSSFKAYANCFMVASGISRSFTELEPALVRDTADIIHAS